MDSHVEWRTKREMEFTRLNTSAENTNTGGEWHMVTAPRAVLKCGKAMLEGQQDQLEGEIYNSLPRAHFLHSGYFCTAREPSAFSPYSQDLHFKGKGLRNQSPRDDERYGFIPPSSGPHPLAQPGFYSPKILRSKHCEAAFSTTKTLNESSQNINMRQFYSHTLPLPRSKTAVLKQSGLFSKPQGIKTSVVEKPRLMKAVISQISPDSNQLSEQQYNGRFQHTKKQDIQNRQFSNQHQTSVNLPGTEISRKEGFVWNHYFESQSKRFLLTQNQSSFSVPKCASYLLPQQQSSVDHLNMHFNSQYSCYCKSRLYNGSCVHNVQDSTDCPQKRQLHSNVSWLNSNLKELGKKKHDCKDIMDSSHGGNNFFSNTSQVDTNSRNVFGQPRVVATLRAACSPRPVRKSTIVEDLKKLIVMDDITDSSQPDSPSLQQTRTNSSLSELIRGSASSSPVLSRHALSRPNYLSLQSSPTVCQPMSTESAVWDSDLPFDHELLPLPNTVDDLDWNSLVNAAEAYELQRTSAFQAFEPNNMHFGRSPVPQSPAYSDQNVPQNVDPFVSGELDDEVFTDLPDQLSHLEVVLRRLSRDLLKEKKDKVALLAEVLKLRMSNQHLKEESLSANAQLNKICQTFNTSMCGVGEERK